MSVILELAERAVAGGRLAIDTEFVSERRYQALLCLAQVAVLDPEAPDGVRTRCSTRSSTSSTRRRWPGCSPTRRSRSWCTRAPGRGDPAAQLGTDVTNVFDTQVAAGFLGFGNQEGYESLVRKVLRLKLKGSEGFTRWDRRPLSAQQLEYAADDARLLLELGTELERLLVERGRLDWAREESQLVGESTDERTPERAYERLPRLGRLSDSGRAVARELAEWREETARAADRPPSTVIPTRR